MDFLSGTARFFCYNRGTSAWAPVQVIGSTVELQAGGTTKAKVDSNGLMGVMMSKAGDLTTSDLASGEWRVSKNTSAGNVYLYVNDGGTIKKVQLT
jgi:hypothetical protein